MQWSAEETCSFICYFQAIVKQNGYFLNSTYRNVLIQNTEPLFNGNESFYIMFLVTTFMNFFLISRFGAENKYCKYFFLNFR